MIIIYENIFNKIVAVTTIAAPPKRVEICANGINSIRFEADKIATSPVPPNPLWHPVTIADSTGYIFMTFPTRKPVVIIVNTTDAHTTTYPTERTAATSFNGIYNNPKPTINGHVKLVEINLYK